MDGSINQFIAPSIIFIYHPTPPRRFGSLKLWRSPLNGKAFPVTGRSRGCVAGWPIRFVPQLTNNEIRATATVADKKIRATANQQGHELNNKYHKLT